MKVLKIAAFALDNEGGNPAGVLISEELPSEQQMLGIASELGYSESAFLQPEGQCWRIRYFSPEMEVPFCGHATIASGAALGERLGAGVYQLQLNDGQISVEVSKTPGRQTLVSLQSPETWSEPVSQQNLEELLKLFNLNQAELHPEYPVRFAFAGAKHAVMVLKTREKLAVMHYDFELGKSWMQQHGLITVSLLWEESKERFHSRNAFAAGGVYEDPATGAAGAALAGYLRDIGWRGSRQFEIIQGEDMGSPSRLQIEYTSEIGSSIKVSGMARMISDE